MAKEIAEGANITRNLANDLRSRRGDRSTFVANRICKKGPSTVERAILLRGKTSCKEEFSGPSGC
jgi:hypothetical protein